MVTVTENDLKELKDLIISQNEKINTELTDITHSKSKTLDISFPTDD